MRPFYSIESVRNFVKKFGETKLIELVHTPGAISRTERGFVEAYRQDQAQKVRAWPSLVLKVLKTLWPIASGLVVALAAYKMGWQ